MAVSDLTTTSLHERIRADDPLVIGIGASAGGIVALRKFFASVPRNAGMTYVVVLHLSPEHESHLAEVLRQVSHIPMTPVSERTLLEVDHAYVISPNVRLALVDGHLDVSEVHTAEERRAPIDFFFRTLAETQRARAISVILSGTGADGSMGMKRVKEMGGACIVQQPSEAEFGDMPRNAIATGFIDYVLPAAEIPARLATYRRHLSAIELPSPPPESTASDQWLADIFTQLRARTRHDFSNYKRTTIMRRVERRMGVNEIASVDEYSRFLHASRDEAQALLRDLLISVTNFFRDAAAFQVLARDVIPHLFEGKGPGDEVRVWVAGCATGEEAYSIAMLLAEHAARLANPPGVQIFATDIDQSALAKARAGLYTINDAADVSSERLQRFFMKEGDSFRVNRELRESILFADHNAIKDPPFSHLDLLSCRNLLIYLNRLAQERLLKVFDFALDPRGYLFLGNSESSDEAGIRFVVVNKEHHIFRSRGLEGAASMPVAAPMPLEQAPPPEGPREQKEVRARISYLEVHQRLLERYAPPSVVVNQDFEIVHLSENAGAFLNFVGGEPTRNLLKVARPELRLELHSVLYLVTGQRSPAEAIAGPLSLGGDLCKVKITANPVSADSDGTNGLILVLFERVSDRSQPDTPLAETSVSEPVARQLQEELVRVKSQRRATIEQYELQQEELKASNEELQAMNEELRSSSEELETSKEELQSVNEELSTVNQELKIKIDELSHASNDTRNLMNSTDLATVFIDRAMRVKLFTPRARAIFNLIPSDAGRPLLDITNRLLYPEMVSDIERVLETLVTSEREVTSIDDRWYTARVLPYRTAEERIAGVVLTFTDITPRRQAEALSQESEERVQLVVDSITDYAIFTTDVEGRVLSWNSGAQRIFGYTAEQIVGEHFATLFLPEDREAGVPAKELAQAREQGRANDERWHLRKNGERFFASGVTAPRWREGRLAGFTKVARDLTAHQQAEEALRISREELEGRVIDRTRQLAESNESLRGEIHDRTQAEGARLQLLRQLVSAQEQERQRISRELHDKLGQEVTALGLRLAALRKASDLPAPARREIENLEEMVKRVDGDLEFFVWELRPTGLDELGLADALLDHVDSWSRYSGVAVRTDFRISRRLPQEIETVLYRVAQEALNNVAKHARAKLVQVTLEDTGEHVLLSIEDDGRGFPPGDGPGDTLGIVGVRERVALIGGTTLIESQPARGTAVRVRVPG